jgi:hypothetical protein
MSKLNVEQIFKYISIEQYIAPSGKICFHLKNVSQGKYGESLDLHGGFDFWNHSMLFDPTSQETAKNLAN